MVTLYLLPYSHEMRYAFDKQVLEKAAKTMKNLVSTNILSVEIDEQLAQQLQDAPEVKQPYSYDIPASYYMKQREFLKNPPSWFLKDGMRVYVMFDKEKRCYWCPSGNNLNSIAKRNPESCLSQALRVELTEDSYVNLYAYFDYSCDSF